MDVVVVRVGKNLKGRVIGFLLGTIGKRALERERAKTVKAIEARNTGARSSGTAETREGEVFLLRNELPDRSGSSLRSSCPQLEPTSSSRGGSAESATPGRRGG